MQSAGPLAPPQDIRAQLEGSAAPPQTAEHSPPRDAFEGFGETLAMHNDWTPPPPTASYAPPVYTPHPAPESHHPPNTRPTSTAPAAMPGLPPHLLTPLLAAPHLATSTQAPGVLGLVLFAAPLALATAAVAALALL